RSRRCTGGGARQVRRRRQDRGRRLPPPGGAGRSRHRVVLRAGLMAGWGDALRWDAGALAAAATAQRGHSTSLASTMRRVATSSPGDWSGAAASAAGSRRRAVVERGEELTGQLAAASAAYS